MEENNISTAIESSAEETTDAFMAGWDDVCDVETGNQSEETEQTTDSVEYSASDTETESGETTVQTTEEPNTTDSNVESSNAVEPKQWQVNHLGERKTFGVDDITPELLQKGLDYDRIHQKWDESKPVMAMFTEFASKAGMSVTDYVAHIRQQAKIADGMSEAEAKRTIALEDREAAVAAAESAAQEQKRIDESAEAQASAERERVNRDLEEFKQAFPEIYELAKSDSKKIPDSVWADVNKGLSITAAYAKYAVSQANIAKTEAERLATSAQQNQKNASRSTGSMKSAGNDKRIKDPFLEGWDA